LTPITQLQFKFTAIPAFATAFSAIIPSATIPSAIIPRALTAFPRAFTTLGAFTLSALTAPYTTTPHANPPAKSLFSLHSVKTFKKSIESIFKKYNP
jgi:hypothetical protein